MFWILLPIRISRSLKKMPYVTIVLITINTFIAVLLALAAKNPQILSKIYQNFGFMADERGWYTWFTYMFLHAGFAHLLGNMIFLWLFGAALEDVLGKSKYLFIYLAGGLMAALAQTSIKIIFLPNAPVAPLIGASGAVGALLGVFILRFFRNEMTVFYFVWFLTIFRWGTFEISSLLALGAWVGMEVVSGFLQILSGAAGGVAHWAHIGGFAFGLLAAKIIKLEVEAGKEYLAEEAATLAKSGDHTEAAAKYEELINKEPASPEVLLKAGRMYANSEQRDKAVKRYVKALEGLLKNNELDKAFEAYSELIEFYYPDLVLEPRLQFRVGTICESKTNFELAVDAFQKVIYNYPRSLQAELSLLRMGQVFLKMGEEEEASKIFREFLDRYPFSQWKALAENEVRKVASHSRARFH